LEEIARDGGKSAFKSLLERLNIRSAPPENSDREHRSVSDASRQQFTPVPIPRRIDTSILAAADLTSDGQFARIGDPNPRLLKQKSLPDGGMLYRFASPPQSHNATHQPSAKQDVELTNCFRGPSLSKNVRMSIADSPEYQKLGRLTGTALNGCGGIAGYSYSGEMDIHVRVMDSADSGKATIFRLIPHHDKLYKSEDNQVFRLPGSATLSDYNHLIRNGNVFDQSGKPPLTINVERYDGKDYLTIKARCDYSLFTESDNHCDIPFRGADTPVNQATCCNDGQLQREDVKYLYRTPLPNGWFNVKFHTAFSQFIGGRDSDFGEPNTLVFLNDDLAFRSFARLGNNDCNHDEDGLSAVCGYHAQFGISDSSLSIAVRIKDPDLRNDEKRHEAGTPYSEFMKSRGFITQPADVVGECQPSSVKKSLDEILRDAGE